MSSKPSKRNDVLDVIAKLKKQQRNINGQNRQFYSGMASADFGSVSGTASSGGGTTVPATNNGLLKTKGDSMIGPIAFSPKTALVVANVIDISKTNETGYSSYVIASATASATTNLNTITGAAFNGQILYMATPATVTIKLKHNVSNIFIADAADYDVVPNSVAVLIFDITRGVGGMWVLISAFARSGAGSGMSNPATALLDMAGYAIENVSYIEGDESASHLIVSSVSGDVLFNHNGWSYNVPTAHSHIFYVNESQVLQISSSVFSFTGSTLFTVSSPVFLTNDVTLGDATSDDINILGRFVSTLTPKTTNLYDLGTTSLRFRNAFLSGDIDISDDILMGGSGSNIVNAGDVSSLTTTVSGLASLNGDVSLGNSTADVILFTGRISGNPDPINSSIELGQSALRWANIFSQKIDITGSSSTATAIKINSTGGIIDFDGNAISLTATTGFQTLPANPVAFINVKVGGTNCRIPYYTA